MNAAWLLGAIGVALASFVQSLTGFGLGLVALAFLPHVMAPATAVVMMTIYGVIISAVLAMQLRAHITVGALGWMLLGTVLGIPVGVWVLASVPASVISRLIGFILVVVALLEWRGVYPKRLAGRQWGLGAGILAGLLGASVGLPGPPVIVYATTQGWTPHATRANLLAFFTLNQTVTLSGYWLAGLLNLEVAGLAAAYAIPAVLGVLAGVVLIGRIDQAAFRRIIFMLIFLSGLSLLIRG